jgi:hypothetical protein
LTGVPDTDPRIIVAGGGHGGYVQDYQYAYAQHGWIPAAPDGAVGNAAWGGNAHGSYTASTPATSTAGGQGAIHNGVQNKSGVPGGASDLYGAGGGWWSGPQGGRVNGTKIGHQSGGGSGYIGGVNNGRVYQCNENFPVPAMDGTEETGHAGSGYARITFLYN